MKEIKGNGSIKLDLISKQWVVSSYWELALIIYAPLAYHYEPTSKNICTSTEGPRLTRFLGLGKNRVTWNSC